MLIDFTYNFIANSFVIGTGFILGSVVVVKCIYEPWVKRLLSEKEIIPYENKYNFVEYYDEEEEYKEKKETNNNNIVNESTPDGNVFMRYDKENEGFEYWCDTKNVKYDYLDTLARKYCLTYDCCGVYKDRKKSIEEEKNKKLKKNEKEKNKEKSDVDKEKEDDDSIFVKPKKIETKAVDRSKGEVAIASNKFIYKGKVTECYFFTVKRDDELKKSGNNKKMSFLDWKMRS